MANNAYTKLWIDTCSVNTRQAQLRLVFNSEKDTLGHKQEQYI